MTEVGPGVEGDPVLSGSKIRPGRFLGPLGRARKLGCGVGGLHTTPQFPGGSAELLLGLLLPQSSLAGFPHTTWSIEQGFSLSARLIFGAG